MGKAIQLKAERRQFRPLTLEERADVVERYKAETLLFCPDAWALRRKWVNKDTGEVQRARCNRWECLYCGPRKVDLWRQLVRIAEPTLFLTLSKAGKTVEEAARALTTFVQALRRGSKGRGRNKIGARPAYPIEYFAVLEQHKDFERNGFHWHLLIRGVEHIPYKEVIQPLWMSATHYDEATGAGAKIAHVERIRNVRAIGYVTKYLMKVVAVGERGTRERPRKHKAAVLVANEQSQEVIVQYVEGPDGERKVIFVRRAYAFRSKTDEQGQLVEEEYRETETIASKARRIRYSRGFFPEKVSDLRARLFAGMEQTEEGKPEQVAQEEEQEKVRSGWVLMEQEDEEARDLEAYKQARLMEALVGVEEGDDLDRQAYEQRKSEAVAEVLEEVRERGRQAYRRRRRQVLMQALEEDRFLSRRVVHIWHYQRQQLRRAG